MKDVVALTYNVDYWDYRGWRDTLAAPENSKRQYKYAKARGDMDVYTPQMIIDGASHVVVHAYQRGSDRRRCEWPPPKPPLLAAFGRASLTVRLRPPTSLPFSCWIAFCAS